MFRAPPIPTPLLAAALLASLPIGAIAQPAFAPPTLLPGDDVVGVAAGEQSAPVVTRGGDQYLAVWQDRSSVYGGEQTDVDIFGMRLDLAGDPIDDTPFPIANGFGYQRSPKVAWNGTSWLVLFESQEPTQFFYETALLGVRVSPQGQALDPTPIHVFSQGSSGSSRLVAMGSQWVVVSQSSDAGQGGLQARRIAADGQLPDAQPVLLVPATFFLYSFTAVATSTELLLGWNTTSGGTVLAGRRYDASLTAISGQFPLSTLNLTSNGAGYYTTWTSGANHLGSPVNLDGTLAIPNGVVIGSSFQTSLPKMSWAGTHWWASWVQINQGIRVGRISPAGAVLDPGGQLIPITTSTTNFLNAHVLAGGPAGQGELVFQDAPSGVGTANYDISGVAIAANVTSSAKVLLSRSAPHQQIPKLTAGPDQLLATFVSEVSGERRAMAQRIGPGGVAIDAQPIEVSAHPQLGSVRAAFDGTRYLIVWSEGGEIYGRRMSPDGSWVDAARFHVITGTAPDVAALGSQFLVVGQQVGITIELLFPVAQRVDGSTGAINGGTLFLGNSFAQAVRVETTGGRWLVAWQRNYSHDNPQAQSEAAFVDPAGVATPFFVIEGNAFTPTMASSPNEVLFVFRTNSFASANNDISARRMLPDGTFPAPSFIVTNATYKQFAPTVIFDGTGFQAAWEDRRNGEAFFDFRTDIYGARISSAGVVLDPTGYAISTSEAGEARPWLARVNDSILMAASVFHDENGLAAWRIETRSTTPCVDALVEYGPACVGSGGFLPGLHASGCPTSGDQVTIVIDQALGGGLALMLLGSGPASLTLQGCTLLLSPVLPVVPVFTLGGAGAGGGSASIPATVPIGAASGVVYLQVFVVDGGVPNGLAATNGLRVEVN